MKVCFENRYSTILTKIANAVKNRVPRLEVVTPPQMGSSLTSVIFHIYLHPTVIIIKIETIKPS